MTIGTRVNAFFSIQASRVPIYATGIATPGREARPRLNLPYRNTSTIGSTDNKP